LGRLAKFLYESSDHVVVVSPAFKEQLIQKWHVNPEKISVVQNGVEPAFFSANGNADRKKELELDFAGKFVVSYIGTLGNACGLSVALEAAHRLQTVLPDVLFLFVGEGAEKSELISSAQRQGLRNVRFLPQQPREKIPGLIRASDLCLVLLKKADVFKTVIPTKMLEFMACGRPVILGVDGQARQILEDARAGLFVEPENSVALAQAIARLHLDQNFRQTLGENGQRHIVEHFSRQQTAKAYAGVLERLIRNRRPARALQH
jgi:glycosyltransferase involved in cell wall biosynthesis